jgi:hypothetical protein
MQNKVNTYRLSSSQYDEYGRAVLHYYSRASEHMRRYFTVYEVSGYPYNGGEHTLELRLTYARLRDFLVVFTRFIDDADDASNEYLNKILTKLIEQEADYYSEFERMELRNHVIQSTGIRERLGCEQVAIIGPNGMVRHLLRPTGTFECTRFTSSGLPMMSREEYSKYVENLLNFVW